MHLRENDERLVHRVVQFHLNLLFGSEAPIGYNRIKVRDERKERPSLGVDAAIAPVVGKTLEKPLRGSGLKQICKDLSDPGITSRGKRWHQGSLH